MSRKDRPRVGLRRTNNTPPPHPIVITPPRWETYELLDAGNAQRLERYGEYRLVRPDTQAIWQPALPQREWDKAVARFERGRRDEGSGDWIQSQRMPERWQLHHDNLRFWVRLTPFRHTGIFPEHSAHWGWMRQQLALVDEPNVLVLFGYTGLHALVAAQAGAKVCQVDASKPATRWAQDNQQLSGMDKSPIRWIVDDAMKFVAREGRRGSQYDMIIMDPPVFGRGPKGEIWRLQEALYPLLEGCVQILSERPVGLLLNAYATNLSALSLANVVQDAMGHYAEQGDVEAGEMALVEQSASRLLPTALYARWTYRPQ